MSEPVVPPLVMVVGVKALRDLGPSLTRALVVTNGQAKMPPGWREDRGAVHVGGGRWLIPAVRVALEEA